jgi:hypothetical protein
MRLNVDITGCPFKLNKATNPGPGSKNPSPDASRLRSQIVASDDAPTSSKLCVAQNRIRRNASQHGNRITIGVRLAERVAEGRRFTKRGSLCRVETIRRSASLIVVLLGTELKRAKTIVKINTIGWA